MRKIVALTLNDADLFDEITAAKQQPRRDYLTASRRAVMSAYEEYSEVAPDLGELDGANLSEEQQEALRHSYNVPTIPMNRLRAALLDRIANVRCPFCSLSESSTLDHYLPKENHPEFSILSKNLIPSCGQCNTRKSKLIIEKDTRARLFLHPYYDEIPDQRFLDVDIVLKRDELLLQFSIFRPAGINVPTFTHLRSHFRLLKLSDRYRRMSLEHLRSRYRSLVRFYGSAQDAQRVASEMLQEAEDYKHEYGINDWRAVLYHALSEDIDFCDGGFEVLARIQ